MSTHSTHATRFNASAHAEKEFLLTIVGRITSIDTLRKMLVQVVSLPRHEVFNSVLVQSNAIRRIVTGERSPEGTYALRGTPPMVRGPVRTGYRRWWHGSSQGAGDGRGRSHRKGP